MLDPLVQLVSLVLKASVGPKDLRVKLDQLVPLAQSVLLDHQVPLVLLVLPALVVMLVLLA